MDVVEIWNEDTKALIALEGAWLTNLSDDNGDILFPRRQLTADDGSVKVRGGSHVCLPQFGPGGESELPQHGFGRTARWEVKGRTESSVMLALQGGGEGYEGLVTALTYTLEDKSLIMRLDVHNTDDHPLRLAPAFHPYFALRPNEQQVEIEGRKVDLIDLREMQLQTGDGQELRTQKRLIRIDSEELHEWALWTDQLGAYVCVEPTLGGYAFLNASPTDQELLQSGEATAYQCRISWIK